MMFKTTANEYLVIYDPETRTFERYKYGKLLLTIPYTSPRWREWYTWMTDHMDNEGLEWLETSR